MLSLTDRSARDLAPPDDLAPVAQVAPLAAARTHHAADPEAVTIIAEIAEVGPRCLEQALVLLEALQVQPTEVVLRTGPSRSAPRRDSR